MLSEDGLKTPITSTLFNLLRFDAAATNAITVAVRFSTVGGESGSADEARDPRGFAVKWVDSVQYTAAGD